MRPFFASRISPRMTTNAASGTPAPKAGTPAEIDQLVADLRQGSRRAIASAITTLEALAPTASELLKKLQPYLGHALIIGLTGPPGAGKSTLVNALIQELRRNDRSVGVIAVDPSSPVSGGAILGDRIRMTAALDDDGVFVRSLASRGYLGGLSPAAVRVIDALDAASFDIILLETVGTGQNEIDVAEVADIRIVASAPGLGDDIQAMKSGLLEIADIMVVNKGDRDGAERTLQQLKGALSIRAGQVADVPIIKTTALSGAGVPELIAAIDKLAAPILSSDATERRRKRARYLIARAAADLVAERIKTGGSDLINALADEILTGEATPSEAAHKLLK